MTIELQGYEFKSFPEDEFMQLARCGDALLVDVKAYNAICKDIMDISFVSNHERYQQAQRHYYECDEIISRMEGTNVLPFVESDRNREQSKAPSSSTRKHKAAQKSLAELESEILAAATQEKAKLALAQVAVTNGYSPELIQSFAQELLEEQGMQPLYDLAKKEYEKCITEMRALELKIADPGERSWKLQQLAKRFRRTEKELRECYCKSLIAYQLPELKTLQELKAEYGDGRKWLLTGFIPKASLVLLHAQGGIGKTLLAHHLIKLIATGTSWEEYQVRLEEQRSILYIQTDTAPAAMIEALNQANITENLPILYHTKWSIEHTAQLYNWLQRERPALVVIDSLTTVNRFNTVNENETEYAQPVLYLRDLASEFGCAFLIIHHSNSEGHARGTRAVRNAVDEVWRLDSVDANDPGNPERLLVQEKSRSRMPMRYRLRFDDDTFEWENQGLATTAPTQEGEEAPKVNRSGRKLIIEHLSANKGVGFAARDLAQAIGINEATTRRELPALYREGLIDRKLNENYASNQSGTPRHLYLIKV